MFNITFSLALVYVSTWLVVNVAPEVGAHCCAAAGLCCGGGGEGCGGCSSQTFSKMLPCLAAQPQAGGAGVAEVMAYLNGCFIPKVGACCRFLGRQEHVRCRLAAWAAKAAGSLVGLGRDQLSSEPRCAVLLPRRRGA